MMKKEDRKSECKKMTDSPVWEDHGMTLEALEHRIAILKKLNPLTENIFMEIFECKSILIWRKIDPRYLRKDLRKSSKTKGTDLVRFSCFKNCLLRFLIKKGEGLIIKEKSRSGDKKIAIYELAEGMSDKELKKRIAVLKGLNPPTENTLMEIFECNGVLIWKKIERQAKRYDKKYGKRDLRALTRFMKKHEKKD
jgi:hypothetical protein